MSVFDSLLHGLDDQDSARAQDLIATGIAADRAEARAGRQPNHAVDVGSRQRRSRLTSTSTTRR